MAIDTPATIAILGAGPIGLEAALYARFLGHSTLIYEQGEVAEHVRLAGHLPIFDKFADCCSNLGLAAIAAQDESYAPPAMNERLTGNEWRTRYLVTLSQTDLLADCLRLQTRVLGVTKGELLKGDLAGNPDRGDWPFRILSVNSAGAETVDEVDAVFDCTGVFSQPNALGEGGMPAIGERILRERIAYHPPDVLTSERDRYAGRHTVVIGSGHSAATTVLALAELRKLVPGTQVNWITRRERANAPTGPVTRMSNDLLISRDELAAQANVLALDQTNVKWLPGTWLERISFVGQRFEMQLSGEHGGTIDCDEVIANVGYHPDESLCCELQVSMDPATQAVSQNLLTGEPNFYILGVKSFGRRSGFLFRDGLNQIRDVFRLIGDRPTLDLYGSAVKLP